jgi:pyruvate ferredoxin oxidoreductase alpha subunit
MLYNETTAALFADGVIIPTDNVIYGLGGRDMTMNDMGEIIKNTKANANAGKVVGSIQSFSGLRGPKLELY